MKDLSQCVERDFSQRSAVDQSGQSRDCSSQPSLLEFECNKISQMRI